MSIEFVLNKTLHTIKLWFIPTWSVAYRGGWFGGFNPPPPRNSKGPPKSC